MARVAGGPATFIFVEGYEELESLSDDSLPASEVHRLGQLADRVGSEVAFGSGFENVRWVGRFVAAAIVDNVTPHLEYPQPSHESFVHRSGSELSEAIDVAAKRYAPVASELLRARLRLGYHGKLR